MSISREKLATLLHGRSYGSEITEEEEDQAREAGLIVLFGYSDDNAEFRGVFSDEVPCHGGTTILVNWEGVLEPHDDCDCPYCGYQKKAKGSMPIVAKWDCNGYSWMYATELAHSCFDIVEGDEKYCRGIVFERGELPALPI